MNTVAQRIRRADPLRPSDIPSLDARARHELKTLLGRPVSDHAPQKGTTARPPARSGRRRQWAITAAVLLLIIAASTAAIGLAHPIPRPATSGLAPRVEFSTDPDEGAAQQRLFERFARTGTYPMSQQELYLQAINASPQLRVDAQHWGGGNGAYRAVGPHTFNIDSSGDDPSPLGGNGTGADTIDVYAMRCAGTGTYTWRVLGHRVGSTTTEVVATAHGHCGPGLTAARYITRGNTITTRLEVAVPAGRSFGIVDIGYDNFGAPILDSAYPTD